MPTQLSTASSSASLRGTILDNLQAGSPLQPPISSILNAALKTQLAATATVAKLPALVGLMSSIPAADLVAAMDLSLQAFAQQKIDPTVAGDPAIKTAIDNRISISSAKRNKRWRLGAPPRIPETPDIGPPSLTNEDVSGLCAEPPLHHLGPSPFSQPIGEQQ